MKCGPAEALAVRHAAVRAAIAAAAARAGRAAGEVTVVAVTKGYGEEVVAQACAAGICEIGENYVQEAWRKKAALGDATLRIRWHLVGHLQRNKARLAVGMFDLIHSLDGLPLAERLDVLGRARGVPVRALVQVKLVREEGKSGLEPAAAAALLAASRGLPGLRVEGLMTVPPPGTPAAVRPFFRRLRELRDAWDDGQLRHLSMGMSADYEVAVEEGATIVRIGTALFGPRPDKQA